MNQPDAGPYARHIPALDGIRGLAILGVAFSHLFPGNTNTPAARRIGDLLVFGATGVDLFFVLSGFLITGILFDSRATPGYFRNFYARRVLRIFPLYYAVLLAFGVLGIVQGLSSHGELLSLSLYLQNTTLIAPRINDYAGPMVLPLPHFWSLAVEEQFYLVWPLLVRLIARRNRLIMVCGLSFLLCPVYRFLLASHGSGLFPVQTNTLARADSLLAGAALALLLRSRLHDVALQYGRVLFYGCGGAILVWLVVNANGLNHPETLSSWGFALRYSLLDAACAGMIAWSLSSRSGGQMLSLRPLRQLGKYSYGLYVLHVIAGYILLHRLREWIAADITSNKLIGGVMAGVVTFAVSYLAAYASYQLYEGRFLRLKRYFEYRKPRESIKAS